MDNDKWCLSISDVYGTVPTVAPEGYEFTGEFRPVKKGEFWYCSTNWAVQASEDYGAHIPKLILRKKPPVPTVKDIYGVEGAQDVRVPEGYELTGEFRIPVKGDLWVNRYQMEADFRGPVAWATPTDSLDGPRLIIRKPEPKPEDIYTVSEEILRGRNYVGFEWTGEFRKLKVGDWFLHCPGGGRVEQVVEPYFANVYRFVMRKLPTVKEVYGKELSELKAPEGYRFTGEFRKPSASDWCMTPGGNDIRYLGIDPKQPHVEPRLILEKIPANPTIEEVYGTANPVIPKGWRFKEFREIKNRENVMYLGVGSFGQMLAGGFSFASLGVPRDDWRIVLEEVQDLSQFKYAIGPEKIYGTELPEVPEGYQVVDFRPIRKGENFIDIYGYASVAMANASTLHPRFILERR